MLVKLILGMIYTGAVDKVDNEYVTVEFCMNKELHYIDIPLATSKCKPTEGMTVFFNTAGIIECLSAQK